MQSLDVVTFGETMVVFNPGQHLPLEYVHEFHKQIGGAEANFSIALTRLGHRVGWFSKLGDDPFGRFILNIVRGEGVDTSRCQFTDEAPTGIFFKEKRSMNNMRIYYYRKNSAASMMRPEEVDEAYIAGAKMVHLTGITPALSESCRQTSFKVIEYAKKHGVKIVFDPNVRLKLWDLDTMRRVMLEMAEQADIILPGLDEGQLLTGKQTPEEIAESFLKGGDNTVIIKLGERGAYYRTPREEGYVPGFPAEVVDPVGAGDGFAAGVVSGILRGESLEQAVRRGNAVGAIVVGANGDVEGLPSLSEVEKVLAGGQDAQDVKR